jgi:flagellar FliL protein
MSVTAMPGAQVADATTDKAEGEKPKKSKKKLVIILLVVLLGAGGGWFELRPQKAGPPTPGTVLPLDSIQINLSGEHYLRIGIALQLVNGSKEADGSKALDAAIDEFSGQSIDRLAKPGTRDTLKADLLKKLEKSYAGEVMGVYFTEFVTQ